MREDAVALVLVPEVVPPVAAVALVGAGLRVVEWWLELPHPATATVAIALTPSIVNCLRIFVSPRQPSGVDYCEFTLPGRLESKRRARIAGARAQEERARWNIGTDRERVYVGALPGMPSPRSS